MTISSIIRYFTLILFLIYGFKGYADNHLELLVSPNTLSQKIKAVATTINQDYQGEDLVVITVLKGAVFVASDLIRHLHLPHTLEYVKTKTSTKFMSDEINVEVSGIENLNVKDKHILIVDDMFGSGNTLTSIMAQLKLKRPKSIKSLVVYAWQVERKTTYFPEYTLFSNQEVQDRFPAIGTNNYVVGYGIDYEGRYRGLPGLYVYRPEGKQRSGN